MRIIAAIYSIGLGVVALWAWGTYFIYEDSTREHLLPAIALNILAMPSSLLVERLVEFVPWILDRPSVMLLLVTGLGMIQAALIWLLAR